MKNYPLFTKNNQNTWRNWQNTYLEELNGKVVSLFDYVNYFAPDYYEQQLKDIKINDDSEETDVLDMSLLNYRGYVIALKKSVEILSNQNISPGSRIISIAQSEGEKDLPTSQNRLNLKNYFIQPIGWASFYTTSYNDNLLIFSWDQYAEETWGTNFRFTFEIYSRRWFIDNIIGESSDGLVFSKDTTNRSINAESSSDDHVIIRDKIGTEWLDSSISTSPFYVCYLTPNNESFNNWEEIIIDSKSTTYTRFVETNKGVYNIALDNETEKWPDHGIALLY